MDLWRQIPFLGLDGPSFLNFYGLVAIVVLIATFLALRFSDRTDQNPPPQAPSRLDPIETAFLVGGVNNVIQTVLYDLYQHGYVYFDGAERVEPGHKTPEPGALDKLHKRVLEGVQSRPKVGEVFQNRAMRREIEEMCAPIIERLRREDLLQPESVKRAKLWALVLGCATLLGLAAAKVAVALSIGKSNVSFLVMLSLFSTAALAVLAAYLTRAHTSRRGEAYLEAMRLAYAGRLTEAAARARDYHAAPNGSYAFEGASLALIGLFGYAALQDTPDKAFADAIKASNSDAGSGSRGCGEASK